MFTCHSCLRRTIRSLVIIDLQTAQSDVLLPSATKTTSSRNHATIASIQKGHHLRLLREAFQSKKETPMSKSERIHGPGPTSRRNIRAKEVNKHHLDIRKEDDTTNLLSKYTADEGLRTELRWTGGDALKLAKSVLDKLKAGDPLNALEMVRLSEKLPGADEKKGVDSVVSWNHVMDYYMSKSLTREAFKVFNEMKKRGHKPDAHTYTIMLRGFTMNHKKAYAVEDAIKVYDSMFRPESNIKPSTIHSNAIINCLGRALNMDALWSVAGRLPDRGPGSADKWTYTTILNTMQACAVRDAAQLAETDGDLEAAAKVIQIAIGEGRKLWEDIVSRWRSGDVNIDQTLVCAMGRLLLLGQKRDWDDVFSLAEQTMRLPRVKPPFVDWGTRKNDEWENALALPPPNEADDGSSGLGRLEAAVADEAAPKAKNEFAVVDLSDRQVRRGNGEDVPSPYANVGNNVLSLLIEAAIKLREIPMGKTYWEKLTNPDNEPFVMPDDDNLHSYLRLLRISRSSKAICDLLRQPVSGALEGVWYRRGTFVIAMSTCARDFKNPNVFTYASTILDLMQAKLTKPDLKVMTMYLSLAVVTTPGVSPEISGVFNASTGENNLIKAIRRFTYSDLDYRIILNQWTESNAKDGDEEKVYVGQSRAKRSRSKREDEAPPSPPEDLLEFMQTLNSAYDKILNFRLKMTEKMATAFTYQKRELNQSLQMLNPDPLSPSRSKAAQEEYVDALTEQGRTFSSQRFPDKLARARDLVSKGPRVVDLEKRHPFRRDLEESGREEQRPEQDRKLGRNTREHQRPGRDSGSAMSFRGSRDDQQPRRDSGSAMSFRGSRDDQRPRRDSESSSRRNNRDDRSSESSMPFRGSRENGRPERDSKSSSWSDSREERRPHRDWKLGSHTRESRWPGRGLNSSESRRGGRDDRPQRRGPDSFPMSEGWGNAWKKSVQEMGKDERRKDWVVV